MDIAINAMPRIDKHVPRILCKDENESGLTAEATDEDVVVEAEEVTLADVSVAAELMELVAVVWTVDELEAEAEAKADDSDELMVLIVIRLEFDDSLEVDLSSLVSVCKSMTVSPEDPCDMERPER